MSCMGTVGVESGGGGGDGGTRPPQLKNQRGRPPRNDDICVPFFLTHMKILHFPPFSK